MLVIEGIPAAMVLLVWEEARPWVARALEIEGGHFAEEDIRAALLSRDMQLWVVRAAENPASAAPDAGRRIRGILVTEIVRYPRRTVCRLVLAGAEDGARAEWLAWRPLIDAWARANGCDLVELYGRPGWARLLPWATRRLVLQWAPEPMEKME